VFIGADMFFFCGGCFFIGGGVVCGGGGGGGSQILLLLLKLYEGTNLFLLQIMFLILQLYSTGFNPTWGYCLWFRRTVCQ